MLVNVTYFIALHNTAVGHGRRETLKAFVRYRVRSKGTVFKVSRRPRVYRPRIYYVAHACKFRTIVALVKSKIEKEHMEVSVIRGII